MADTHRYQGEVVTIVSKTDEECTIRLADGTEKTVPQHEVTVEPAQEAAAEQPAEATKPPQS